MQLTKKTHKKVAQVLANASVVLAGGALTLSTTQAEESAWKAEVAVLSYQEDNNRVKAIEPVINLKKNYADDKALGIKLVFDALSGASPNGAVAKSQTITSPSGNQTTTTANEVPSFHFEDKRTALGVSWQQPIADNLRINIGGNLSSETDFKSLGFNGALAKDFNQKNTTVSAGLSVEANQIAAVYGGVPKAFSNNNDLIKEGNKTRNQIDLQLGLTQVLNQRSLIQVNYGLSTSSGYHSDPYKVLSVLDANLDVVSNAGQSLVIVEKRPDSRTRHSLYAQWKYAFDEDVLDVSYRIAKDDWGILSNTVDTKYRFTLTEKAYLEPHFRWYSQSEADFYKYYLKNGVDVVGGVVQVANASADTRLAAFTATTVGLKWGYVFQEDNEFNVRVERYNQKLNIDHPSSLSTDDLNLSATWIQLGYSFKW